MSAFVMILEGETEAQSGDMADGEKRPRTLPASCCSCWESCLLPHRPGHQPGGQALM